MPNVFWDLTDEQIIQGIKCMEIMFLPIPINHKEIYETFKYNPVLQQLAKLWIECDKDRTFMKLAYSDEIIQFEEDEQFRVSQLRGPIGPTGVPGFLYKFKQTFKMPKNLKRFVADNKEYRNSKLSGPRLEVLNNWKYRK